MRTPLLTFALLSSLHLPAFAIEFGSRRSGKADLRCEQQGSGLFIKLPSESAPARIWQMDAHKIESSELDVTGFRVTNCSGCFDFTAEVSGSEVHGRVQDNFIKYEIFDSKKETWTTLLDHVDCKPTR